MGSNVHSAPDQGDSGQLLTPLRAVPPTEVSHEPRRSFNFSSCHIKKSEDN